MEQQEPQDTSLIVNLKYPIKIGSNPEVNIVKLQRIKGKHLKGLNVYQLNYKDQMTLAERLTGLTTSFFDEMDAYDIEQVLVIVGNLLNGSQATGS